MPSLALVGASGKLAEKIVARALERGFRVNALVRDPSKLRRQAEALTVLEIDAATGRGFDAGLAHCQYVICAAGGAVTEHVTHVVKELQKRKKPVQRVALISRIGASESRGQAVKVSGPLQGLLPVLRPAVFRDVTGAEGLLRVAKLPYSIFRATRLTDDPATGCVVAVPANEPPPHRVSRADLAQFVVDSLESGEYLGREATVGAPTR